jgi:hypothetical protein
MSRLSADRGVAGRPDRSERQTLLARVAWFVRERTRKDDVAALSLLLRHEPKTDSSHTVIGPLILPRVPGLTQNELVLAFTGALDPLDAALIVELVAPDSFISRVRCTGLLRLPASVSQSHHLGNPLLLALWKQRMNLIVSAAWHNPAGAGRRLEKAFLAPLSFLEADWGVVLRLMRQLGVYWRRVPTRGSFSIGEEQFVVSARDYGLLVTLFLSDSFGTCGCSLNRRLLFAPPQ